MKSQASWEIEAKVLQLSNDQSQACIFLRESAILSAWKGDWPPSLKMLNANFTIKIWELNAGL